MQTKKRSDRVGLVFLGAATALLGACGKSSDEEAIEVRQDFYASLADCEADWGQAPGDCSAIREATGNGQLPQIGDNDAAAALAGASSGPNPGASTGSSIYSSSSSYRYAGPRFYWDRQAGLPRSIEVPGRIYPNSYLARGASQSLGTTRSTTVPTGNSRAIGHSVSVARGGFGGGAHGTSGG
jgi:hypothetical protein